MFLKTDYMFINIFFTNLFVGLLSFEIFEQKNKRIKDVLIISSAKLLCVFAIIYNL